MELDVMSSLSVMSISIAAIVEPLLGDAYTVLLGAVGSVLAALVMRRHPDPVYRPATAPRLALPGPPVRVRRWPLRQRGQFASRGPIVRLY